MFSTDAPFAKSILLLVFTALVIHMALYITTEYSSNKYSSNNAISSVYISLFYCIDASFTSTFTISGKSFHRS